MPASVDFTVPPMYACTMLRTMFSVTETAPATTTSPTATEMTGRRAMMLDASEALIATAPLAVTVPAPVYARVVATVVLVDSAPAAATATIEPLAAAANVVALIDTRDTCTWPP